MARLHEHQAKALLGAAGVVVPDGEAVTTPEQARAVATRLGGRVVLKAQAWVTARAAAGGVKFADTPEQAETFAHDMLRLRFGNFPVREVLVERALEIDRELFVSLAIDDRAQAPVVLLSTEGGSGVEDRGASVARIDVDPVEGVRREAVLDVLAAESLDDAVRESVAAAIALVADIARRYDARSLEINPLVITRDGTVAAADCRMTIDDYAVFRHPELAIEIARELDHPPTDLERIAYRIEQADHRGTFYFAQLAAEPAADSRGLVGFHGAGGGGSMMSMDAITRLDFTLANFCDTSGNPSAAKVYRAARIILAQPGLVGYFGSGSGVASQEQYHSAYGLAKAFCELGLSIPAVIRLGGNAEDRAVEILNDACRDLPGCVEGYKKDDTPAAIAERFAEMVKSSGGATWTPPRRHVPEYVGSSYSFEITGGSVWIDHDRCDAETTKLVVANSAGLFEDREGRPVPAVALQDIASKDSELVALEVECRRAGRPVVFVDLAIADLDQEHRVDPH